MKNTSANAARRLTSAMLGSFHDSVATRNEFLHLSRHHDVN